MYGHRTTFWDILARVGGIAFCVFILTGLATLGLFILLGEIRMYNQKKLGKKFADDIERFRNDFE